MQRISVPSLFEYRLRAWIFPAIGFLFPVLGLIFQPGNPKFYGLWLVPVLLTLYPGLLFLIPFRNLWHVFAEGENLLIQKGNKEIRFALRDISNINQNYERRNRPRLFSNDNRMLTVKEVILNHPVDGISRFRYVATEEDEKDDELLIQPWKKMYRKRVQESLKRRGAKR